MTKYVSGTPRSVSVLLLHGRHRRHTPREMQQLTLAVVCLPSDSPFRLSYKIAATAFRVSENYNPIRPGSITFDEHVSDHAPGRRSLLPRWRVPLPLRVA